MTNLVSVLLYNCSCVIWLERCIVCRCTTDDSKNYLLIIFLINMYCDLGLKNSIFLCRVSNLFCCVVFYFWSKKRNDWFKWSIYLVWFLSSRIARGVHVCIKYGLSLLSLMVVWVLYSRRSFFLKVNLSVSDFSKSIWI